REKEANAEAIVTRLIANKLYCKTNSSVEDYNIISIERLCDITKGFTLGNYKKIEERYKINELIENKKFKIDEFALTSAYNRLSLEYNIRIIPNTCNDHRCLRQSTIINMIDCVDVKTNDVGSFDVSRTDTRIIAGLCVIKFPRQTQDVELPQYTSNEYNN
ncbi:hypothetical protein V1478_010309, partial [Vespula squamosa]